jgi:hypothetical protein
MKDNVEASRTTVLRLIQAKDFSDRIHVFLVDSMPRMKELRGSAGCGGAIAKIRVVFEVVDATNNGYSTQEFCHAIASAKWGKPERWLDEGFADYSDERWVRVIRRLCRALIFLRFLHSLPIIRATRFHKSGITSVSKHGFRRSQMRLRGEGCANGKKRGRNPSRRRTISASVSPAFARDSGPGSICRSGGLTANPSSRQTNDHATAARIRVAAGGRLIGSSGAIGAHVWQLGKQATRGDYCNRSDWKTPPIRVIRVIRG